MTPILANRILLIAIVVFVAIMIARVILTHLRYRAARRRHEDAYRAVDRRIRDITARDFGE